MPGSLIEAWRCSVCLLPAPSPLEGGAGWWVDRQPGRLPRLWCPLCALEEGLDDR